MPRIDSIATAIPPEAPSGPPPVTALPGTADPAQPTPTLPPVPPPAPPSHAYPPPAAQVTPAIVSLAAAAQPGQPQRLTIRLDPGALGAVEVRIERSPHGPTRIELAVERPDTLLTLMADRPALHAALDLAGVPPEGRTVQFSLTPSDSGLNNAPGGGTGSGTGNGSGSASGGGSRDRDGAPPPPPRRIRLRTGIDITA